MLATPSTRVSSVDTGRAAAAAIPRPGDLPVLLAAADRHPDAPLGTADDLRGRELSVLAELLLRGVRAYRLGLGLDLSDLLDLAVLQRLPEPGLGPLASLHHEPGLVGGTLDHVRVGGQRQLSGHHQPLPTAGGVPPRPALRTGPTIRLSSAITTATACWPALSRAAEEAGGFGSVADGTVNCKLRVASRYGRAATSASLGS